MLSSRSRAPRPLILASFRLFAPAPKCPQKALQADLGSLKEARAALDAEAGQVAEADPTSGRESDLEELAVKQGVRLRLRLRLRIPTPERAFNSVALGAERDCSVH